MAMNDQQRESTAKYMYDLSKGIALLTVIKPLWEPGTDVWSVLFGLTATFTLFIWAYIAEGRK